LVKQSLQDRQKKLIQEQEKLSLLNNEVSNLENEFAKDVEKLREMIDQLSIDISYHEKDYDEKKNYF